MVYHKPIIPSPARLPGSVPTPRRFRWSFRPSSCAEPCAPRRRRRGSQWRATLTRLPRQLRTPREWRDFEGTQVLFGVGKGGEQGGRMMTLSMVKIVVFSMFHLVSWWVFHPTDDMVGFDWFDRLLEKGLQYLIFCERMVLLLQGTEKNGGFNGGLNGGLPNKVWHCLVL